MLISVQLLGCPLSLDMRDLSPDHRKVIPIMVRI